MVKLSTRERFFYEHAPYSVAPGETNIQGRVRSARTLATAEARLVAGPYYVEIDDDNEPYDGDGPYDGPLWVVTLLRVPDDSTDPEVLGSVGGVACPAGDPYFRVVGAELAAEHLPPLVEYDADDRCKGCGEHIADPHAPGCPRES